MLRSASQNFAVPREEGGFFLESARGRTAGLSVVDLAFLVVAARDPVSRRRAAVLREAHGQNQGVHGPRARHASGSHQGQDGG